MDIGDADTSIRPPIIQNKVNRTWTDMYGRQQDYKDIPWNEMTGKSPTYRSRRPLEYGIEHDLYLEYSIE